MKIIRSLAIVGIVLALLTVVTGCNTVEGMGKDIERGGEKIQEIAD
jgi:predicted small secreted protein